MLRKIVALIALASVAIVLTGCATFTPTGITYHHGNPSDGTFWMTIVKNNVHNGTQVAALWYCQNKAEGPACVEAKLLKCTNAAECQTEASQIFQTQLGGYTIVQPQ